MKTTFTFLAGLFLAISLNAADINITSADNLATAYANAATGDVLILGDGTYVVDANITMTKAITIKALNPKMATITGAGFLFTTNSTGNLTVRDLILDGTKAVAGTYASYVVDFAGTAYPLAVNNVLFENCTITNYGNCFLRANRGECTCESLKVNNCIIKSNGAVAAYPFFQTTKTRFGTGSLELTNSTVADFSNEFIQNYSTTAGADNTATYLFKNNTFYNTVTVAARKPFSFTSGKVYVQNNIFVKSTTGTRTTDVTINAAVASAEFTNNVINNFDAGLLLNSTGWTVNTGNQDVDPLFKDVTTYDFTLPANSALITANIGDPRWFGTSTSVKNTTVKALTVYPNPTADIIYFGKTISKLEIVDLVGKVVKSQYNVSESNLKSLSAGTYLVRAIEEDGTLSVQKVARK